MTPARSTIDRFRAAGLWLGGCVLAAMPVLADDQPGHDLVVPAGFTVELVAGDPQIQFPMFATFDDQGRLYVAESSGLDLYAELVSQTRRCRVSRLEDSDGDGRYEQSQVFVDGLVFPMGLAWHEGRLYVADPPDLVVYEDRNGDGRGDARQVILTGFGHTDNGSLHGLTFGPDGWLYMTMGHPDGYRLKRGDGSWLVGTNGALLRVRPDGTDPQAVCRGFTNLVEVEFLADGSAIGTSNIFQHPSGGLRDALVDLVEGGVYPLNLYDDETEHISTGELLPPITRLSTTGISGLVRYRGTAFPGELRGNLFSAQHNTRKVQRHDLTRNESTWSSVDHDFLTTDNPDFHPSDVLEAADGSLLVLDTGAWYVQHCPTGRIQRSASRGGIYRIRYAAGAHPDDPGGTQVDWQSAGVERLLELMCDLRPVVADRAARVLERRHGSIAAAVQRWLEGAPPADCVSTAAWVLARRGDEESRELLRELASRADPATAAVAVQGLALCGDKSAAPVLTMLLEHDSLPLRRQAALALVRCGASESLPALWTAFAEPGDPFLAHALLYAAAHLADVNDLRAALDHPSPRVQRGALVLLDQSPHHALDQQVVVARLGAADAALRRAAIESLTRHPEWAAAAGSLIDTLLVADALNDEARNSLRSLVIAFQSHADVADTVARAVAGERNDVQVDRRVLLLEVLADATSAGDPAIWTLAIGAALNDEEMTVRSAAARAAVSLDLQNLLPQLITLSRQDATHPALRLDVMRAVVRHQRRLDEDAVQWLLVQLVDDDRPLEQMAAAEVMAQSQLTSDEVAALLAAIRERLIVSPIVLWPLLERSAAGDAAPAVLAFLNARLSAGWRPSDAELLRLCAQLPAEQRARGDELLARAQLARQQIAQQLEHYLLLAGQGDAARGRTVFFGTQAACSTCHRVGNDGGQIGPDLTRIGASRTVRDLVESIVVPSSTIAQGFDPYKIQTVDGLVFNGIVQHQTPETLVIIDSARQPTRIRRDEIEIMQRSPTSIMPDGFGAKLAPEQFGDLLAWLQSLR